MEKYFYDQEYKDTLYKLSIDYNTLKHTPENLPRTFFTELE